MGWGRARGRAGAGVGWGGAGRPCRRWIDSLSGGRGVAGRAGVGVAGKGRGGVGRGWVGQAVQEREGQGSAACSVPCHVGEGWRVEGFWDPGAQPCALTHRHRDETRAASQGQVGEFEQPGCDS